MKDNLTREEVLALPAGRELDERLAAALHLKPAGAPGYREEGKVVGPWKVVHVGAGVLKWRAQHSYSTDIAAAWLVVEALARREFFVQVQSFWQAGWTAAVTTPDPDPDEQLPLLERPWPKRYEAGAATGPLAICRAALLALLEAPASPTTATKEGPAAAAPTTEGTEKPCQ